MRDSLGADISHIQTKTPAEFEENFRQYGAQGNSIVFGHGFEFQDAAVRVAPSYPKTIYVVTSGRVTAPNVAGISFAFEEASYQAGIIAGAMTKTNTHRPHWRHGTAAGQGQLHRVRARRDSR